MVNRIVVVDDSWVNDQITYAVRSTLPQVITGLAGGDYVVVNTTTSAVQTVPAPEYASLAVAYDPAKSDPVSVTTGSAGRLYWVVTKNQTQSRSEVVSHTGAELDNGVGQQSYGFVETDAGVVAFDIIDLPPVDYDLYLHCVLCAAGTDTPISLVASTRVKAGSNSTQAAITVLSGTANVTEYTDGNGQKWKAYEFVTNGSFSVTRGGEVEYELVGGGAGGGGFQTYKRCGGGGAGRRLAGTTTLTAGTYPVTIGAGGSGNAAAATAAIEGGDTVAISLTALGGGRGGTDETAAKIATGRGNGGGQSGVKAVGVASSDGAGFTGGGAEANAAGGGAGTGGNGGSGVATPAIKGGAGGIGVSSAITGTAVMVCVGGAGSGPSDTQHGATAPGGAAAGSATQQVGIDATTYGSGGGGVSSGGTALRGGNGRQGRFVIRVKV